MKVIQCDRCKRVYEKPGTIYEFSDEGFLIKETVNNIRLESFSYLERVDLCDSCMSEFLNFLKGPSSASTDEDISPEYEKRGCYPDWARKGDEEHG